MCLITEHARLKQQYQDLLDINTALQSQVDELESRIPAPIVPVTDLKMISRQDYLTRMLGAGVKPIDLGTPLDWELSLTSKAELDRIAPELVFPADWYVAEIKDCEDYGLDAQCKAANYRVSGIRLCLGDMPLGYHGWVITMDKEFNIWWLESNAGFPYAGVWYKIGNEGYSPKKVFA